MNGSTAAPDPLIQEISIPLYRGKGWLKFVGIVSIVSGVISALSIFGIVFAWLPIWMGVLLFQSASSVEQAQLSGNRDELAKAMDKLRLYFLITGVAIIVGLVITAISSVILFIFQAGLIAALMEAVQQGGY
jgi:hypothetical protein